MWGGRPIEWGGRPIARDRPTVSRPGRSAAQIRNQRIVLRQGLVIPLINIVRLVKRLGLALRGERLQHPILNDLAKLGVDRVGDVPVQPTLRVDVDRAGVLRELGATSVAEPRSRRVFVPA
jgi:hypothetical protein